MISYLQKEGGITANGLTISEKNELEKLRIEIKRYRELESHDTNVDTKSNHSQSVYFLT